MATAFASVGVSVAFAQSIAVPIWPGTGLSLAWLGVLGGALVALDAGLAPRLRLGRTLAAVAVCAAIVVLAVPALTVAGPRASSTLTNGPAQHASGVRRRGRPR